MKNIIIIWAGAAGLMAAATILEGSPPEKTEFHIHLFEKNTSPGKKVIISGGGRCNVTTSIEDKKILAMKYTRGWEFIRKAIGKFSPRKCREWFESHGVPLKIQDDLRVFPVSDDGRDIVGIFEDIFAKHRDKITLHYWEWVDEVSKSSSRSIWDEYDFSGVSLSFSERIVSTPAWVKSVPKRSSLRKDDKKEKNSENFFITTKKWIYEADILIITTGGNAYSHTGSTGDGYAFARSLGHSVTELWPSLSSFLTREKWLHELSGLAFEDARIVIPAETRYPLSSLQSKDPSHRVGRDSRAENDKMIELAWPLLLTHFGISWPLTFMASSHLAFEKIGSKSVGNTWDTRMLSEQNPPALSGSPPSQGGYPISLSPLSSMWCSEWEAFLKDQSQNHPKKLIVSILSEKLPRRFADAFVKEYFLHVETTFAGSIARSDRERLSKLLGDGIPLTLLERRPGDEFVTAGGVNTDELDPETMESRIHENLYFAGEVLNVDGYTWGFSLQICWASGYAVGKSVWTKFFLN